ncbi:uncharacterized protein LOC119610846 [Lucilia sericata]|uniref:uncharacterized protein LOC119610846 n=1 Tax=Lucilia sericata TaxID=13632 RepID=UPI0018A7FE2F|nr:uncharacterized protein LOC119610846 [Lucilia sericata]XP_037822170.1 uncharacterized protein LOC119610846 [Lucilia sericata]
MTDTNGNEISSNCDINRQSESPARTIDSHDSTTGSMDTIVDRSTHNSAAATTTTTANNHEEMMQSTIEQSTNTTNMQQQHNSLTNSEIAMLQQQNPSGSDDELMLKHQQDLQHQQQMQKQMQQKPMDAQSHIYSSPVYDEKPPQPLKLTAATLLESTKSKELEKPKLISHEEFKQQLQETIASRAATLDSRISKKQRFPPELIKDDGSSTKSSKSLKKKRSMPKSSTACCSAFPVQIILGLLQLVLAISLVALGSLLIVRDASLSTAGCGIWTGLIAAVTGSLGVVGLRKTQTSFLALSLVCIASSTLALAISGIGLSRDINRSKEEFNLLNANSEISAASGLIFTLFLHFIVSILSVYRCALQMCSRSKAAELQDIIIKSNVNGLSLHPDSVDQYVKAMSIAGSEKNNNEKLAALWMYASQNNMMTPQPKMAPNGRPVMLIPATGNLPPPPTMMMGPPPPQSMMGPPPPMAAYRGMTLPYMRTTSMPVIYAPPPGSMPGTYRTHKSSKSNDGRKKRKAMAAAQVLRSGKSNADRRQRRKSDADVVDGNPSFQYHGLDRAIADNFLARQEQSHTGSHLDYSSSSGASDTYGNTAPSRASSKTKIVCRDVVM